jgi:hypothetical protein
MKWLEKYSRKQYCRTLHAMDEYRAGNISLETLIDTLDNALDIWEHDPEHWSDPLLLQCADLLNRYSDARYQLATAVSFEDRLRIEKTFDALRSQLFNNYMQRTLEGMASTLDAFERGRITLRDLAYSLGHQGFYLFEGIRVPESWGEWSNSLVSILYSFEDAADEIGAGRPEEYLYAPNWVADNIVELKVLIQLAYKALGRAADGNY